MKMSYVEFMIRSLDFPQVDYETKKEKKKESNKQKLGFGTPIKDLPQDVIAQMR